MLVRTRLTIALAAAGAVLATAGSTSAQYATKQTITTEAAVQMGAACETMARAQNWRVAIAVVDVVGTPIFVDRMDGTRGIAAEGALAKAKGAMRAHASTKQQGGFLARPEGQAIVAQAGMFPVPGGVPIMANGKIVGAVGVGGMTPDQDDQCAQAAVDSLARR